MSITDLLLKVCLPITGLLLNQRFVTEVVFILKWSITDGVCIYLLSVTENVSLTENLFLINFQWYINLLFCPNTDGMYIYFSFITERMHLCGWFIAEEEGVLKVYLL